MTMTMMMSQGVTKNKMNTASSFESMQKMQQLFQRLPEYMVYS